MVSHPLDSRRVLKVVMALSDVAFAKVSHPLDSRRVLKDVQGTRPTVHHPVSHPLDSRRVLKAGRPDAEVAVQHRLTPPRLAESTESSRCAGGDAGHRVSHPLDSRRVLKVWNTCPPMCARPAVSHPLDSRRVLKAWPCTFRQVSVVVSHPLDSRRVLKACMPRCGNKQPPGLTPPRLAESTESWASRAAASARRVSHPLDSRRVLKARNRYRQRRVRQLVSHPLDSRRVLKARPCQTRPSRCPVSHPLDSRRVLKAAVAPQYRRRLHGLTPPRLAESTESSWNAYHTPVSGSSHTPSTRGEY